MQYYYADGDHQKGPVDLDRLKASNIKPDTLVWRDGMAEWQPAGKVPELASLFAQPDAHSNSAQPAPLQMAAPSAPQHAQGQPADASFPSAPPIGYQQPGYQQPGYAPPGYAPPGYGQEFGYVAPPSQGMSIASLVLGIVSLVFVCAWPISILCSILAITFGHIGYSTYKRQTGQASGMAVAGLICGYIVPAVLATVIVSGCSLMALGR